jgi:hypothetical protein
MDLPKHARWVAIIPSPLWGEDEGEGGISGRLGCGILPKGRIGVLPKGRDILKVTFTKISKSILTLTIKIAEYLQSPKILQKFYKSFTHISLL